MPLQDWPHPADSRGVSILLNVGTAAACAALMAPSAFAQGYQLEEVPARWRFSLESIDVNGVGDGSLLGVQYELMDVFDTPGLFAGLGGYGSMTGDLGGFFAGGLNLGWRQSLAERFAVEAGAFVGAGGGGAAAVGASGLVLRPFIALEHTSENYGLRLELANTSLAGADFNEVALSLGLTLPVRFLSGHQRSSWADPISISALDFERWELESAVAFLDPTSGSQRRDGTTFGDGLSLGGIKLNADLSDSSHIPIEAWGAVGGGTSGYRALMAGYGLHGPLLSSVVPGGLQWELELLGGLAGGGNTDTGGGLAFEANAGVRARFAANWTAHVALSYFDAPTGDLTATGLQLGLAWDPRMLSLGSSYDRSRLATEALPPSEGLFDVWQMGTAYKIYRPRAGKLKSDGAKYASSLHLAGLSAERHINEFFSVLVRAFGAVEGNVGGYSEGLAGMRLAASPFDFLGNTELYLEYDIGAAGGGAVNVGSGLIHQTTAGLAWSPWTGVEVGFGIGRMNARLSGDFSASVIEAGVSFDVARLIARN